MTLTIREHKSSSYGPRTWANAAEADVTIALAVDYTTAGERLTHKAAGDKYLKLDFVNVERLHLARTLYGWMRQNNARTINVAGNGIYTLHKHGFSIEYMKQVLLDILTPVHKFWKIDKLKSGGQTGVDIAGGYAGWKLGIDTVLTLPKGFKQRHEDGVDRDHTEEQIRKQIIG